MNVITGKVVQVSRRADQGVTRPFLCRADNDAWYWVKGRCAGAQALCFEWLAGRIAQELGLPIPAFAQLEVQKSIIKYSAMDEIEDLGAGIVFASENFDGASEFTMSNIDHSDLGFRRKLLVFDWWVQNQDRILGELGGNVNLLYAPATKETVIIDHNIAFDSTFDIAAFKRDHVFRNDLDSWDETFSREIEPAMLSIATRMDEFWAELPEEWLESAILQSNFSFDRVKLVIDRFQQASDLFGSMTQ